MSCGGSELMLCRLSWSFHILASANYYTARSTTILASELANHNNFGTYQIIHMLCWLHYYRYFHLHITCYLLASYYSLVCST